jgi:hypothetical protein
MEGLCRGCGAAVLPATRGWFNLTSARAVLTPRTPYNRQAHTTTDTQHRETQQTARHDRDPTRGGTGARLVREKSHALKHTHNTLTKQRGRLPPDNTRNEGARDPAKSVGHWQGTSAREQGVGGGGVSRDMVVG